MENTGTLTKVQTGDMQRAEVVHTHPMRTRSQNNIFRPKKIFTASRHPVPPEIEPTSVTIAVKNPKWKEVMQAELDALMKNGT